MNSLSKKPMWMELISSWIDEACCTEIILFYFWFWQVEKGFGRGLSVQFWVWIGACKLAVTWPPSSVWLGCECNRGYKTNSLFWWFLALYLLQRETNSVDCLLLQLNVPSWDCYIDSLTLESPMHTYQPPSQCSIEIIQECGFENWAGIDKIRTKHQNILTCFLKTDYSEGNPWLVIWVFFYRAFHPDLNLGFQSFSPFTLIHLD